MSQLDLVSNDEDNISGGEHKTRRQYYDDEDNIFYGEDKTRGKETLRNVVGERKLRRVFPATLYDGDDDGGDDGDDDGGDDGGEDGDGDGGDDSDGGGDDNSDCDGNHNGDNDGSNLIIIAHGEPDVVRHNRHKVNHRHHRPEKIKKNEKKRSLNSHHQKIYYDYFKKMFTNIT